MIKTKTKLIMLKYYSCLKGKKHTKAASKSFEKI